MPTGSAPPEHIWQSSLIVAHSHWFHRVILRARVSFLRHLPLGSKRKRALIQFFSPQFTVGVEAIVRNEQRLVLVLEATYVKELQLPGGAVHHGETPEAALEREVWEETGRHIAECQYAGMLFESRLHNLVLVYRVTLAPGAIRLSEEHSAWRLSEPQGLPSEVRARYDVAFNSESGSVSAVK